MEFAEANKLLVLAIIRDQGAYKEVMSTEFNRYLAGISDESEALASRVETGPK